MQLSSLTLVQVLFMPFNPFALLISVSDSSVLTLIVHKRIYKCLVPCVRRRVCVRTESASNKLSDPQYLHLLCQPWHPVSIVTEQSMHEKIKKKEPHGSIFTNPFLGW